MTSQFSPGEIRAATEVHRELGPEYTDAVVESFLDRVDREIIARMDAHLAAACCNGQAQPAHPVNRRTLLAGAGIGIFVTSVPCILVAAGGGGLVAKSETSVLMVIAIIWAAAAAIATCLFVQRSTRRGPLTGR
jgi:hypothetical protein